jgi:hypothetical protein
MTKRSPSSKGPRVSPPHEGPSEPMTDELRERARQLMIRGSSAGADRSRVRPMGVEKYLYQFMRNPEGREQRKTATYADNWERTFGKKADEPADFDEQEPKPKRRR